MDKKVIEYEGEMPSAILQERIGADDFYSPQDIRRIILESFPSKDGKLFLGLDYILVGDTSIQDELDAERLFRRTDIPRDDMVKKAIPTYEERGEDTRIQIVESQVYVDKSKMTSWYRRHVCHLFLTDMGYVLDFFGTIDSNSPD